MRMRQRQCRVVFEDRVAVRKDADRRLSIAGVTFVDALPWVP